MKSALKKKKTLLNFAKKQTIPTLEYIRVGPDSLMCHNRETYLVLKGNYGLDIGFHKYDTLEHNVTYDVDADNYLDFGNLSGVKDELVIDSNYFEDLLPFTSKDEIRMYLNGIAINDGHLVACDGRILKAYPLGKGYNDYIIPRTSVDVLVKTCKRFKVEVITCIFDDTFMSVETDHFHFRCRLIQRDYPRWKNIVPVKYENFVTINQLPKLSNVKALLNGRNNGVSLGMKDGKVTLKFPDFPEKNMLIGSFQGKFETEIGFNYALLYTASKNLTNFNLKFNNELSPVGINEAIVMPLKL